MRPQDHEQAFLARGLRPRRFSAADPRRSIAEALQYAREYDWVGHQIHTLLAMAYLLLLPLATAPKDWAFGLLAIWTIVRLPHTWRSYGVVMKWPLFWLAGLWIAWQTLSIAWSSNPAQAWDELKVFRMLATPLLLWPILDRAPQLIMATLAGTLAQSGVQVAQELRWIDLPGGDGGRLRGLLHPIHSAMWFGAAMLWHLSAAVHGGESGALRLRPAWRWTSAVLAIVSLAGLLATGSRGPWIAAAAALLAMLIVLALRRPAARPSLAVASAVVAAGIVISILASPALISQRLADARKEIDDANQRQVYWTSTGLRMALWDWALQVWRTSPVIGVGAGDFRTEYTKLEDFQRAADVAMEQALVDEVPGYAQALAAGEDPTRLRRYQRGVRAGEGRIDYITRDHAHSSYLHTLANYGVIGLLLLVAWLATLARQCWRDRPDHPYSDGMFFVMICWLVGAQFDCYELNGHQLGLLALLATLTMPGRAPVRWSWRRPTGDDG